MCTTYRSIVSNTLEGPTVMREVLHFIGCGSLENFLVHLKRNNCKDFDCDIIQNIISTCEKCKTEAEQQENFSKNRNSMSVDEINEYKKKIQYRYEEFQRRCAALNF